ncbi:UDP-N-acetylmuramoyl-tripeptide--D-alanyl-D-alanine ligase [Rothia sp. ZJ932]|uniref:UDP-N-acetylmuramoyl-tripeptide--D-alanyl-D- alanine ligase n=1 Tax=Rothia sp. ZJ932 TaxID=2810516 RepID=UPI0019686544|nr:UDP-N-acetylmuramoyl-tripeptide--D-alanyl-D-alanine ligase [Rothia sp. ZJ932]QRZ60940.1 UDP-N-acetylmuramoyl-tripeptide--D-alanyl-D-alanine ligase [Rothia sp. ZJ932]
MIELSSRQVAEAVNGTLVGCSDDEAQKITVTSATTDSREVVAGTLFLAKPGEIMDGHRFVPQAFVAGASLALVERVVTQGSGEPYPAVVVDDVVLAMGRLASYCIEKMRAAGELTVIGITGSAGKTTTKDLLAGIFATAGETVAPVGSFNGEVGVPLTVFRADESTRYLVIEMGADGVGHIEYLASMVKPDYGVILKVGTAHAGEFGGIDNIEKTKGELAEGILQGLALNDDDERVRRMLPRAVAPTFFFGVGEKNADAPNAPRVYATQLVTAASGCPEFMLHFPSGEKFEIASKLIGEHHVHNLLAAATVAYQIGIQPQVIVKQLNTQGAVSRWRMERTDRADGVSVINDAYNANPESMAAALRALAQLGRGEQPRRTWAVLGAMLELGEVSVEEHDRLGRLVVRMNISKLIAIGDEAKPIYNAAHLEGSWGNEATWVATADEAHEILRAELEPGDIVLFKSSNGAGLRILGDAVAQDTHVAGSNETRTAYWLSAGDFVDAVDSDTDE